MRHRGPDDTGLFADADAGIALGHRRLSVVDLTAAGHQPMASPGGRYVMTYNGEVFNHAALRNELERHGFEFRGHSDTEVMLAAIERWGLTVALQRFNGMFAFALWDRAERALWLARDRLGIKPLYFGRLGSTLVFASELKAIRALPAFDADIDRFALMLLMRHGYIPAPHSIYRNLRKLPPGTTLRLDARDARGAVGVDALAARAASYWSAREVAATGTANPDVLPDAEAIDALDGLLRDAVAMQMEADVPLGAFLSGGIDSSTVVAMMQAQSARPIHTFSIGFDERGFDESPYATAVARQLGTDHHVLRVTPRDALDVVPALPTMFDEPFADPSQIPTHLIAKLARRSVTVSLSGDGGDELFGGYRRYFEAERYRRIARVLPAGLRRSAADVLRDPGAWMPRLFGGIAQRLPPSLRPRNPMAAAATLADMLDAEDDDCRYLRLVSHWRDAARLVTGCEGSPDVSIGTVPPLPSVGSFERMLYRDLVTYLPDDCLAKVDRASMAVGLEVRVPLLDHRVVEFAWRLPRRQKVRQRRGKWILRQVLHRYVPPALVDRPKQGFSVPISDWLRAPLRDWAEALLDARKLRAEGFFDAAAIRNVWEGHQRGQSSEPYRLWDVLMFEAWLDSARRTTLE